MEKRRYVRQAIDLDVRITLQGGRPQACQVKDFSLGGVFVVCKGRKPDISADSEPSELGDRPVELQFSAESRGTKQQYRLTGRIARVLQNGFGIEFVDPEPSTLLVMQELANLSHNTFVETRSQDAASEEATADPPTIVKRNRVGIIETLKELVSQYLNRVLEALFEEVEEKLFKSAKNAPNLVKETELFDALKEIKNIRSLVEQSFHKAVMNHVASPGYQQLSGPEASAQIEGELTLVDPDKFQDWLRIKGILEKITPRYKDTQYELLARLSAVSSTKIDEFNNPIGPLEICGTFYDAVQELGAGRVAREAIFDAFESTVVSDLGVLYDEVNSMFVSKGILPTVEPPKITVPKNPKTPTPQPADQSGLPGAAGDPPPAGAHGSQGAYAGAAPSQTGAPPSPANPGSAVQGGAASASVNQGPTAHGGGAPAPAASSPAAHGGVASAPAGSGQAAHGGGAAAGSVGGGANPTDTSERRVVSGVPGSQPGRRRGATSTMGQIAQPGAFAYETAHTLLGLQRHANWTGGQPPSGAPTGSASGAGVPATEAPGSAYDRNEIMNVLPSLQNQSGSGGGAPGGVNLKERIQSALAARQPTGADKTLGEAEDAAIDLTAGLVESIVDDVLVSDEIRSQFKQLQIPLLKAMIKNEGFIADSKHPARRVVDQLGALTIPKGEAGAKLQKKVSQVVSRIASTEGDGESEFADAADQLDLVIKDQVAAYEKNVRSVVEACKQQAETTQSIRKDAVAQQKAQRKVPEELRQWLERAGRLQVGDRVVIDKGGRAHQEALAWISSDQEKYVFVDGIGEKASSMIRQELAMLLKRGLLKVLAEASVPATERGMHAILRKMHEDLADKATQDPMTGLLNQKAFLDRVNRAVSDAIQTSSEHILCYLDLDHFGEINKKWGEIASDKLLKRFGIVLKKNMGDKGVTARLLEDEFGLVLYGSTQEKGREFADRLRRAVASAKIYWKGETLPLSVSIGVVPITNQSESVTALMGAAKAACVKAKKSGRNRVEVFQPKPETVKVRSGMNDTFVVTKILEGDRLQLQAQRVEPIGTDAAGKPHYEILLGIRNNKDEFVSPEPFMRMAERGNQVTQVDRWVIRTALQWMAKNKRRLLQLGGCSINLSGLSLNDDSLMQYVIDQFMQTKVPPSKVVFEVTESAAIERLSTAEEFLRVMKDYGCRFSLEDFGTGHSSYEYLRDLPVDFVKIDGMFVKELDTNSSDYAMVKSIAEIGHLMGKKTIAESVESEAILEKVKEIGIDYVQGTVVEKPLLLQQLG